MTFPCAAFLFSEPQSQSFFFLFFILSRERLYMLSGITVSVVFSDNQFRLGSNADTDSAPEKDNTREKSRMMVLMRNRLTRTPISTDGNETKWYLHASLVVRRIPSPCALQLPLCFVPIPFCGVPLCMMYVIACSYKIRTHSYWRFTEDKLLINDAQAVFISLRRN